MSFITIPIGLCSEGIFMAQPRVPLAGERTLVTIFKILFRPFSQGMFLLLLVMHNNQH